MSNEIPVEVYEAVAKLNELNYFHAIESGNPKLMADSLKRMAHALSMVEVMNYEKGKEND